MAKIYLVWNEESAEGVVFTDRVDAVYAATGRTSRFGVSTIADAWRETYAEDGEQYEIREIEI